MIRKSAGNNKRSRVHISASRAGRLYRLLKQLDRQPVPRAVLLKKLRVGMRTFYRDVDLLRECGIVVDVNVDGEGYSLPGTINDALNRLPFPDPELTFGDLEVLMRGRSATHDRMRLLFKKVTR